MSLVGLESKWSQVRILVLAALLAPAAYLAGENLGYRDGIKAQIGGPGQFTTAIVEWQDTSKRKVVVYLNDGANGYSFWLTLNPGYLHYTAAAKIFTCDNTNRDSIRECLERGRAWSRDDLEGHESRIIGGSLKPRADDDSTPETEATEILHAKLKAQEDEIEILRADVNRMALKIALLERERTR